MKNDKKHAVIEIHSLELDDCFATIRSALTQVIDQLDGVKNLKASRKELKRYRLAISAIERQVNLHRKDQQELVQSS